MKNYKKLAESLLELSGLIKEAVNVEPVVSSITKLASYNEVPKDLKGKLASVSFLLKDNDDMFTLIIDPIKDKDLDKERKNSSSKENVTPKDKNYIKVINFIKKQLSKIGQDPESEFFNKSISSLGMYKIYTKDLNVSIWLRNN